MPENPQPFWTPFVSKFVVKNYEKLPNLTRSFLAQQNSELEEELRGKVSALKSLTIDIGTEVREHNRLLKDVDDDFDSTLGKPSYGLSQSAENYIYIFCNSETQLHIAGQSRIFYKFQSRDCQEIWRSFHSYVWQSFLVKFAYSGLG